MLFIKILAIRTESLDSFFFTFPKKWFGHAMVKNLLTLGWPWSQYASIVSPKFQKF